MTVIKFVLLHKWDPENCLTAACMFYFGEREATIRFCSESCPLKLGYTTSGNLLVIKAALFCTRQKRKICLSTKFFLFAVTSLALLFYKTLYMWNRAIVLIPLIFLPVWSASLADITIRCWPFPANCISAISFCLYCNDSPA